MLINTITLQVLNARFIHHSWGSAQWIQGDTFFDFPLTHGFIAFLFILVKLIAAEGARIAKKAVALAKHAGRRIIKAEDIRIAPE